MMSLENTARSKQAKTIMSMLNANERRPAPVFRVMFESLLWFAQVEFDGIARRMGGKGDRSLRSFMAEGVLEQFQKGHFQKLGINLNRFRA